jgi:hypothetical protein
MSTSTMMTSEFNKRLEELCAVHINREQCVTEEDYEKYRESCARIVALCMEKQKLFDIDCKNPPSKEMLDVLEDAFDFSSEGGSYQIMQELRSFSTPLQIIHLLLNKYYGKYELDSYFIDTLYHCVYLIQGKTYDIENIKQQYIKAFESHRMIELFNTKSFERKKSFITNYIMCSQPKMHSQLDIFASFLKCHIDPSETISNCIREYIINYMQLPNSELNTILETLCQKYTSATCKNEKQKILDEIVKSCIEHKNLFDINHQNSPSKEMIRILQRAFKFFPKNDILKIQVKELWEYTSPAHITYMLNALYK